MYKDEKLEAYLVSMGLGREADIDCYEFFSVKFVQQHILDISWLSSTSRTDEQRLDFMLYKELLKEAVSDCVDCCNNDILNLSSFRELI